MGTVHHLNPPRTLAHIVAEILLDNARMCDVLEACPLDGAAFGILDKRLTENKAEARAIITNLTGIDAEELIGALA